MRNTKWDSIWIFNFFFAIVLVIVGIACFANRESKPENVKIQHNIKKEQVAIDYERKLIRQETASKINDSIAKQKVNLDDQKKTFSDQIERGINMAYVETKTQSDYDKLKTKLPDYLGHSMAKKIIQLDKPTVNQSGKKSMPFNGVKDFKIAYGRYDYKNKTIQAKVYVKYLTKKESVQLPGKNAPKTSGRSEGSNVFTIMINLRNKQIELNDFEQGKGVAAYE